MIYILLTVFGAVIALGSFLGGLYIGVKLHPNNSKPALQTATEGKKAIHAELTEEQLRERRKRQIELSNFYNYNGNEQTAPEDMIHTREG